jgi:hypothetical protein
MTTDGTNAAPEAVIIYPPFVATSVNGPHLAMGVLAAYLRSRSIRTMTWDANIRFVRWLLSPAMMTARMDALRHAADQLARRPRLTGEEYAVYRYLSKVRHIREDLADAMRTGDDSAFGALGKVLEFLYGDSLSRILRSLDRIVESGGAPGADPTILDRFIDEQAEFLAALESAAVVGINVSFSEQLHAACMFARAIETSLGEKRPVVLLGGTQISLLDGAQVGRLLQLPFLDGCVIYEGERPLEAAIGQVRRAMAAGNRPTDADLADVPNLCTRRHPFARTFADPVAPDAFPCPSFAEQDIGLYFPPRVLPVYVTKGCYWGKCTFCDYTKLNTPTSRRWVERTVPRVIDDVKELLGRHAVTTFHLISDAVPPAWYREFADDVIADGLQVQFFSYMKNERPAVLTQDFFHKLSRAGVKLLICGVESPVDRILDVIDKGTRRSDIEANFRMMAAAGIRGVCNLIPDYPSTRFDEVQEVIQFVRDNVDYIPVLSCQFFDLSIASAIAGHPDMYDVKIENETPTGSAHGCHTLSFTHATLTPAQLQWMRQVFPSLSESVARYHHTRTAVSAVAHPDFQWAGSAFLFNPVRVMTSRFANPRSRSNGAAATGIEAGPEVLWLRQPRLDVQIELPASAAPLVDLMAGETLVSFDSMLAAMPGLPAHELCDLLTDLTRMGFVRQVFGGGPAELSRDLDALQAQLGRPPEESIGCPPRKVLRVIPSSPSPA